MSQITKTFSDQTYTCTITVEEHYAKERLDHFVAHFFPSISRELLKKKIRAGDITISNRPAPHRPSVKVYPQEVVTICLRRTIHEDEFWQGKKISLEVHPEIIFEDDLLIVLSKPPYMSTHPTGRHLFYCATVFCEEKWGQAVYSVHRLDRETSGVLLMAKNASTAHHITSAFEHGQVQKCYFFAAKLAANLPLPTGQFTRQERLGVMGEGRERVYVQAFAPTANEGKEATTDFKILQINDQYALALAFPHTGRQHQIRVHAMISGIPLVGDKLYLGSYPLFQRFKEGKASVTDHQLMELPRQALHAMAIKLPYRGQSQIFISPRLPTDLIEWIGARFKLDIELFTQQITQEIYRYFTPTPQN